MRTKKLLQLSVNSLRNQLWIATCDNDQSKVSYRMKHYEQKNKNESYEEKGKVELRKWIARY